MVIKQVCHSWNKYNEFVRYIKRKSDVNFEDYPRVYFISNGEDIYESKIDRLARIFSSEGFTDTKRIIIDRLAREMSPYEQLEYQLSEEKQYQEAKNLIFIYSGRGDEYALSLGNDVIQYQQLLRIINNIYPETLVFMLINYHYAKLKNEPNDPTKIPANNCYQNIFQMRIDSGRFSLDEYLEKNLPLSKEKEKKKFYILMKKINMEGRKKLYQNHLSSSIYNFRLFSHHYNRRQIFDQSHLYSEE